MTSRTVDQDISVDISVDISLVKNKLNFKIFCREKIGFVSPERSFRLNFSPKKSSYPEILLLILLPHC